MSTSILVHLAAAPRLLDLAGARRLVAPATLGDIAVLMAYLEDHAGGVAFGSAEAVFALIDGPGLGLATYLALRRHRPGLGLDEAATIAAGMADAEPMAMLLAFLRRAKAKAKDKDKGDGDARPAESSGWCRLFADAMKLHKAWTHADVAGMTLDQVEHAFSGEVEAGDGLSLDEVEAILAGEGGATDGG